MEAIKEHISAHHTQKVCEDITPKRKITKL